MASDFGLTICPLSPSASLSNTGRMSPRLERGGSARPKPAARPASSESGGTEGTSTVKLRSCGSFMLRLCVRKRLTQDQPRDHFRGRILEKNLKNPELLARHGRFPGSAWIHCNSL